MMSATRPTATISVEVVTGEAPAQSCLFTGGAMGEPPEPEGTHARESIRRLQERHGVEVSLLASGRLGIQALEEPPAWLREAIEEVSSIYIDWLRHLEKARDCPVLSSWLAEWMPEHAAGRATTDPVERWSRWADHAALEGMEPGAIWEQEVLEELVQEAVATGCNPKKRARVDHVVAE